MSSLKIRLKILLLLLFLASCPIFAAAVRLPGNCGSDFSLLNSTQKRAAVGSSAKHATPTEVKDLSDTQSLVDGRPARRLVTGNGSAEPGFRNGGIYFFERDGQPRVLKILRLDPSESIPTARALEGIVLAETQGGAKLYRFGTVTQTSPTGEKRQLVYVEMEQLFPGGAPKTWKQAIQEGGTTLSRLTEVRGDGKTALEEMGELYAKAVIDGVVPVDSDFIVSSERRVRWIDGDSWVAVDWRSHPNKEHLNAYCEALSEFLFRFSKQHPTVAKQFLIAFLKHIKQSKLPNPDKEKLLQTLFQREQQGTLRPFFRTNDYYVVKMGLLPENAPPPQDLWPVVKTLYDGL